MNTRIEEIDGKFFATLEGDPLFFYDGLEVLPKISLFVGIKSPLRYIPAVEPFSEKK